MAESTSESLPDMPAGWTAEHWRRALCFKETHEWHGSIDVLLPYVAGTGEPALCQPGDVLAVSVQGLVKPRSIVVMGEKSEPFGTICVYLGLFYSPDNTGLEADAAVFCGLGADDSGLVLDIVPMPELIHVARAVGFVTEGGAFRDLQAWKFPERERGLVEKLAAEAWHLHSFPIAAFDKGGMDRRPLPLSHRGSTSVH
jgi:hypothetical protein